jgi:hypothetical protein
MNLRQQSRGGRQSRNPVCGLQSGVRMRHLQRDLRIAQRIPCQSHTEPTA